mmetsp:Transcript_22674/g.47312  ORF Transcript_22674/g.47312 Transcript_22674/m.47312 type:complete len:92 (-) Transcript_22674:128-403(-)
MTSAVAWKEHAACKGRLPRSFKREASSGKPGFLLRLSNAPKPLQSSCMVVSGILEMTSWLFLQQTKVVKWNDLLNARAVERGSRKREMSKE